MLLAKISMVGSAFAALHVQKFWDKNDTTCAGISAPLLVSIKESSEPCSPQTCVCSDVSCYSINTCSSESISQITSSFDTKKYIAVDFFGDTTCKSVSSTSFYLADTCIPLGRALSYSSASGSGEVKAYGTNCQGNGETFARTSCTISGQTSTIIRGSAPVTNTTASTSATASTTAVSRTTTTPSLSASIQSSFLSFSAMFAAGSMYAAFF